MKPKSNVDMHTITPKGIDRRVLIIQSQMKQYRVPFFCRLHEALEGDGIHLTVAHSDPVADELGKADNAELPGNVGLKVQGHWLFDNRLLYQSLWKPAGNAHLVVIEQANKYLANSLLLGLSRLKLKRVAFWGHGRNRQGDPESLSERVKRHTIKWVDWWFAYTEGVRDYVAALGYPPERITVVYNSIDTSEFGRVLANITLDEVCLARQRLSISQDAKVGLFCGGLYADKHLHFLFEACAQVRRRMSDFHLVVIGGGVEHEKVRAVAQDRSWIHYLGPLFGVEKATYFRLADIFLMPGLVGLGILDSFVAQLPIITTSVPIHSPEIDYLESGTNGFIVNPDARHYAEAIIHVLRTPELLWRLRLGAQESARRYSMEAMVHNFRSGLVKALNHSC